MSSSSSSSDTQNAIESVSRQESAALRGRRRQQLDDEFITGHTHVREDGDKIHRIEYDDEETGHTHVVELNYSKLFAAAPSTTSNLEVLRIEAQLVANGTELENPHVPPNDAVLETAQDVLADEGLTPAWEVCDR